MFNLNTMEKNKKYQVIKTPLQSPKIEIKKETTTPMEEEINTKIDLKKKTIKEDEKEIDSEDELDIKKDEIKDNKNTFNDLYEKSNNQWWDGYNNEKNVLIDDFDRTCIKLSYYLKIWGDNYRFNGEIKGSIIQPIYNKLIITSNYNIEELFYDEEKPDIELVNALKRRFEEIYVYDKRQLREVKEIIKKDYINRFLDLKIYKHNLI